MDEQRQSRNRRPGPSAAQRNRQHHIESVAHHFLAETREPECVAPEEPAQLLVATRSAARATAAWTARLVRALVGTDGAVATDDRLTSCCRVSERAGLEWSVGSYFPGRDPRTQKRGDPGAELAPAVRGAGRIWRIDGDVPVDPGGREQWIHHLGALDDSYLDWCEVSLPENEAPARHVLWCVGGEQAESWAEAQLLGRLLLATGAERLTVVQLPAGWPAGAAPWKQRMRRWVGGNGAHPAADRLVALARAVAPQVRAARWDWQEGRAGGSRHWRRLLSGS